MGRDLLAAARAAGGLDGGARARFRSAERRALDVRARPRAWRASRRGKGAIAPGSTPTSSSGIRRQRSTSSPRVLHHRHKLTPYAGAHASRRRRSDLPARVRGSSSGASSSGRRAGEILLPGPRMDRLHRARRPRLRAPRRRRARGERRVLRPEGKPRQAGARRFSASTSTPTAASGWTAGRRGAGASPGTTGASCGSACRAQSAASSWTPRTSGATTPKPARSRHARSRASRRDATGRGDPLGGDPAASRPAGRLRESLSPSRSSGASRTCGSTSFPTAASRGCASTGVVLPDPDASRPARKASRPRGGRERRARPRGERHVLRRPPQPDPAGPRPRHERRLGDQAPAGARHDWAIVQPRGARRRSAAPRWTRAHFKGNAPGSCSLEVARAGGRAARESHDRQRRMEGALAAHAAPASYTVHRFEEDLLAAGEATHARLNIFPDGGVSRLRLFARLAP